MRRVIFAPYYVWSFSQSFPLLFFGILKYLNIWNPDIDEKLPCLIGKLEDLGLSYSYVERGLFTYFQVYTPQYETPKP
jgi:hypothetical protein